MSDTALNIQAFSTHSRQLSSLVCLTFDLLIQYHTKSGSGSLSRKFGDHRVSASGVFGFSIWFDTAFNLLAFTDCTERTYLEMILFDCMQKKTSWMSYRETYIHPNIHTYTHIHSGRQTEPTITLTIPHSIL